jgi:hypothetical protein
MTPEEKAKEMLLNFGQCAGTYLNETVFGICKRSALLCCDEIIKTGPISFQQQQDDNPDIIISNVPFWESVKECIQLMPGDTRTIEQRRVDAHLKHVRKRP